MYKNGGKKERRKITGEKRQNQGKGEQENKIRIQKAHCFLASCFQD
jgi:hypothetical protein